MIQQIDEALEENGTPFKGLDKHLEKVEMPDPNKKGMLGQLNFGYNQYAGTADPEKVRRRRAKNKVASKSRNNNRKKK